MAIILNLWYNEFGDEMVKNYTVFDVETANNMRESICSIGIVRVENNEIVFAKEYLINPECDFNYFNIMVHGITPEAVTWSPAFDEIWEDIKIYFENTTLVAHNAKSMDLCALTRTLKRYRIEPIEFDYICTLQLARKLIPKSITKSHRLNDLCDLLNIQLAHHHDALDDALGCQGILEYFNNTYPEEVVPKPYNI